MPRKTPIGWTNYSSNPIRFRRKSDGKAGWHCEKISPGCAHCYSETIDNRFGMRLGFTKANSELIEPYLDEKELAELVKLSRKGPAMVFPGDMTDLFLDLIPDAMLDRFFATVAIARNLTFQVLTKRPERMRSYFTRPGLHNDLELAADAIFPSQGHPHIGGKHMLSPLPLSNLHLGVSAENQEQADKRIPILLGIPAAVRFVSFEPLLGPIAAWTWLHRVAIPKHREHWPAERVRNFWAIIGGESGANRRPMQLEWMSSLAEQCQSAGVATFIKQDSAFKDGQQGNIPDSLWSLKQFPEPQPIGA